MTEREKGIVKIIEDYKHQISSELLEKSPRDPDFHRLRLFRSKMAELVNKINIYCENNCRD